jgi:hypothetical protein
LGVVVACRLALLIYVLVLVLVLVLLLLAAGGSRVAEAVLNGWRAVG